MEPIKFYTADQVAKILNISVYTLYRHLKKGKIKSVRFSKKGHFRIGEEELKKILDSKP